MKERKLKILWDSYAKDCCSIVSNHESVISSLPLTENNRNTRLLVDILHKLVSVIFERFRDSHWSVIYWLRYTTRCLVMLLVDTCSAQGSELTSLFATVSYTPLWVAFSGNTPSKENSLIYLNNKKQQRYSITSPSFNMTICNSQYITKNVSPLEFHHNFIIWCSHIERFLDIDQR